MFIGMKINMNSKTELRHRPGNGSDEYADGAGSKDQPTK